MTSSTLRHLNVIPELFHCSCWVHGIVS